MRNYKRKTSRGTTPLDVYKQAITLVTEQNQSIRSVAKELNICHVSLSRFVRKHKEGKELAFGYKKRVILNETQEKELWQYLIERSKIFYGIISTELRRSAYKFATSSNVKVPQTWHKNQEAGHDWYASYMRRNPGIPIFKCPATALSNSTSFKKENASQFFAKLDELISSYNFLPSRIWNLDEVDIGIDFENISVQDLKRLDSVISDDKKTLLTIRLSVNASGNTISPMLVFPTCHKKASVLLEDISQNSSSTNPECDMTSVFLTYLNHFIEFVKPTETNPVLLLLDNNSMYADLEVLNKAKENNIILMSFPPYTKHKLQPLIGVSEHFKEHYGKVQRKWLENNASESVTVCDLLDLVKETWQRVLTSEKIQKGFSIAGVYPFNPKVFEKFCSTTPDSADIAFVSIENDTDGNDRAPKNDISIERDGGEVSVNIKIENDDNRRLSMDIENNEVNIDIKLENEENFD